MLFILVFCCSCAVNPITGEKELMFFGADQDVTIGRKYAPEITKQMGGRIENSSLQSYINEVGQRIANVTGGPDWEYHFVALNDESVNAFALPGGHIFITRGMLEMLQTESQLAGILAHEIVHVVARDSTNMMSNQIGIDILLSAVTSEDTPESVLTVTDITRQILGLKYSRKDEYEADLGGLEYMYRAGYNPWGAVETMQMLESQSDIRPIEFLSTHPSPQNRLGYLSERIQRNYYNVADLKTGKEDYRQAVLQQLPKNL